MPTAALPLRAALLRGALVTVANWPIVLVDLAIESLYKFTLVVPIVAGGFMVAVLLGADVRVLFAEDLLSAGDRILGLLMGRPVAFGAYVGAVSLVAVGGGLLLFLVKSGTLAVLVEGERRAGAAELWTFRPETLRPAAAFSLDLMLEAVPRFARRVTILAIGLSAGYAAIVAGYFLTVAWGFRVVSEWVWAPAGSLLVLLATSTVVVLAAVLSLVHDLLRIIVLTDDCGVREAAARLGAFLVADARQVLGIFAVMTALYGVAAAIGLLLAGGLALVAYVPLVGLIVLPLQAGAWLVRGVIFQWLALTALSAYQMQYRRFAASCVGSAVPVGQS